jgi:stage V sporulation protein R
LKSEFQELIRNDAKGIYKNLDINRVPLKPDYDLLGFVVDNSPNMTDWKHDVIDIVRDTGKYFIPQIQTKIMNEGWASMTHYDICHELDLPPEWHIPFIKMHNQVIRPHLGGLNPYHMGFVIFNDIRERFGMEECFVARECAHDVSFIRQYLTRDLVEKLGLFSYSDKKDKGVTIDEIHDDEGWEKIKASLLTTVGTNGIPVLYVDELQKDGTLVLRHEHDGRDLELDHADNVAKHIKQLWGGELKLFTVIEEETWEI